MIDDLDFDRISTRFWSHADAEEEYQCWPWLGATSPKGDGIFRASKQNYSATALAYELSYGPVPSGQRILRSCADTSCVNPKHLFLSPPKEATPLKRECSVDGCRRLFAEDELCTPHFQHRQKKLEREELP